MQRLFLALIAAICAAVIAAPTAQADPTWPPRPVKQVYNYCWEGRVTSGCVTLPATLGRRVDRLSGINRVCYVPGGCR